MSDIDRFNKVIEYVASAKGRGYKTKANASRVWVKDTCNICDKVVGRAKKAHWNTFCGECRKIKKFFMGNIKK